MNWEIQHFSDYKSGIFENEMFNALLTTREKQLSWVKVSSYKEISLWVKAWIFLK